MNNRLFSITALIIGMLLCSLVSYQSAYAESPLSIDITECKINYLDVPKTMPITTTGGDAVSLKIAVESNTEKEVLSNALRIHRDSIKELRALGLKIERLSVEDSFNGKKRYWRLYTNSIEYPGLDKQVKITLGAINIVDKKPKLGATKTIYIKVSQPFSKPIEISSVETPAATAEAPATEAPVPAYIAPATGAEPTIEPQVSSPTASQAAPTAQLQADLSTGAELESATVTPKAVIYKVMEEPEQDPAAVHCYVVLENGKIIDSYFYDTDRGKFGPKYPTNSGTLPQYYIPSSQTIRDELRSMTVKMKPGSKIQEIVFASDGKGYYALDKEGNIYTVGSAKNFMTAFSNLAYIQKLLNPNRGTGAVSAIRIAPSGDGIYILLSTGMILVDGDAVHYGDGLNDAVATDGIVANDLELVTDKFNRVIGYCILWSNGEIHSFGDNLLVPRFNKITPMDSDDILHPDGIIHSTNAIKLELTLDGKGAYVLDRSGDIYMTGSAVAFTKIWISSFSQTAAHNNFIRDCVKGIDGLAWARDMKVVYNYERKPLGMYLLNSEGRIWVIGDIPGYVDIEDNRRGLSTNLILPLTLGYYARAVADQEPPRITKIRFDTGTGYKEAPLMPPVNTAIDCASLMEGVIYGKPGMRFNVEVDLEDAKGLSRDALVFINSEKGVEPIKEGEPLLSCVNLDKHAKKGTWRMQGKFSKNIPFMKGGFWQFISFKAGYRPGLFSEEYAIPVIADSSVSTLDVAVYDLNNGNKRLVTGDTFRANDINEVHLRIEAADTVYGIPPGDYGFFDSIPALVVDNLKHLVDYRGLDLLTGTFKTKGRLSPIVEEKREEAVKNGAMYVKRVWEIWGTLCNKGNLNIRVRNNNDKPPEESEIILFTDMVGSNLPPTVKSLPEERFANPYLMVINTGDVASTPTILGKYSQCQVIEAGLEITDPERNPVRCSWFLASKKTGKKILMHDESLDSGSNWVNPYLSSIGVYGTRPVYSILKYDIPLDVEPGEYYIIAEINDGMNKVIWGPRATTIEPLPPEITVPEIVVYDYLSNKYNSNEPTFVSDSDIVTWTPGTQHAVELEVFAKNIGCNPVKLTIENQEEMLRGVDISGPLPPPTYPPKGMEYTVNAGEYPKMHRWWINADYIIKNGDIVIKVTKIIQRGAEILKTIQGPLSISVTKKIRLGMSNKNPNMSPQFPAAPVTTPAEKTAPPTYTLSVGTYPTGSGDVNGESAINQSLSEGTLCTLTASPADGYEFEYWVLMGKDGRYSTDNPLQFNINSLMALYAIFKQKQYHLTVLISPIGSGDVNGESRIDQSFAAGGEAITLTASPADGYEFGYWLLKGKDGWYSTDNPLQLNINSIMVLCAIFREKRYLTVNISPPGSGTVNGQSDINQRFATVTGGGITLTAHPQAGYQFKGWSRDYSENTNPVFSIINPVFILMNKNEVITAVFEKKPVVKLASKPASVQPKTNISAVTAPVDIPKTPPAVPVDTGKTETAVVKPVTYTLTVNNGSDSASRPYTRGQKVNISAGTAPVGYEFKAWRVDKGSTANIEKSGDASTTVTMLEDTTVTAEYKPKNYTLTVNKGSGSGTYAYNTKVTIKANEPQAGYQFKGWDGDFKGNTTFADITMDTHKTITAIFEEKPAIRYTLTIANATSTGGTYNQDTAVTITARPAPAGYEFDRWVGNTAGDTANIADVKASSTTITMRSNAGITANYRLLPNVPPQLSGYFYGLGSGRRVDIGSSSNPTTIAITDQTENFKIHLEGIDPDAKACSVKFNHTNGKGGPSLLGRMGAIQLTQTKANTAKWDLTISGKKIGAGTYPVVMSITENAANGATSNELGFVIQVGREK